MDQSPAPTSTNNSFVPDSWPGAFGAYKFSRDAVKFNLGTVLGVIGLMIGLSIVADMLTTDKNVTQLLNNLVGIWLGAASTYVFLRSVRGTKVAFGEALSKGLTFFFKYLLLNIVLFFLLLGSLLLLIVPFFFVLPRTLLAPYFLIDKDMGPIEALKASWNASKGHVAQIWGIIGASIAMALLIIVLVGIYFLIMYSAVFAVLYLYIMKNHQTEANDAVSPVAAAPQSTVS